MFKKTINKLWLDLVIGIGYIAALATGDEFAEYGIASGVAIHEWTSLIVGALFALHVVVHWKWIVNVTKRIFKKTPHKTRINYLLNAMLLFAVGLTGVSGILISSTLNIFPESSLLTNLHHLSTNLSTLLVVSHVLYHWKWILNAVKRYIFKIAPGKSNLKKLPGLGVAQIEKA